MWKKSATHLYNTMVYLCMWLQIWSVAVPLYKIIQWPWRGIVDICHMWSSPCTIYSETRSTHWMKISDRTLEAGDERWHLMNNGTIKEVAYMTCHQAQRSYTQTTTSTCPIMRIKVSRSNMKDHRLITDHWCILLTDARSPTDNENGNQGTRVQTNKCE